MIVHISITCALCGEERTGHESRRELAVELPEELAFNTHILIEQIEEVNRTLREEGWGEEYVGLEGQEEPINVCPKHVGDDPDRA